VNVLVGLDVGTGGARAVAVDEGGGVVEAGLEPWEVDRLLYNHLDEFLAAVEAGGGEQST
jgi:ribulose kinase